MTTIELTEDERHAVFHAWRVTTAVYAEIAYDPRNSESVRDVYHGRILTLARAFYKLEDAAQ